MVVAVCASCGAARIAMQPKLQLGKRKPAKDGMEGEKTAKKDAVKKAKAGDTDKGRDVSTTTKAKEAKKVKVAKGGDQKGATKGDARPTKGPFAMQNKRSRGSWAWGQVRRA